MVLFGINLVVTLLVCGSVGPGVAKLNRIFGLIPWAGRAPFYLLQLYIALAVLWIGSQRPLSALNGATLGLACTIPLLLWSIATKCVPAVQIAYVISGFSQEWLIAWLRNRWSSKSVRKSIEA
jgi:hypothetical protein